MVDVFERYDIPRELEALNQKEMAELIGVSVRTLIRWDKNRILIARRNPSGKPFYIMQDYIDYIEQGRKRGESQDV